MYLMKVRSRELRKKIFFCWRSVIKIAGFDSNPSVRGTDPRIRIRTKMSRINHTGPKKNTREIPEMSSFFFRFYGKCLLPQLLAPNGLKIKDLFFLKFFILRVITGCM
jgi:hypothetical protein